MPTRVTTGLVRQTTGLPWVVPRRAGGRCRLLGGVGDRGDDLAAGDTHPDLGLEAGDRARLVGVDRLLHLHGLEDDDQVALGHGGAVLDRDLDDRALHRGGEGVTGRARTAAATAALARLLRGA